MCRIKAQAIFSGLLNFSSASVWVVTAKSGVDGGAEASQTGGLTGRESEGGGRDSPEPVSSASESSSEDAFVADSSVDQLIAYDLPKLSTKLRTSVGAQAELGRPGEEISGKVSPRCGGLESPARRRDLGPVSSPLKKGLKNVVVARRTQSLTSAEERKTILPSSLVAKAAWHAKRTLYKLSVLREGWASVRTQLAARKVHVPELGMAAYMLGILAYCVGTGQSGFYFYLSTQGLGYLIVGLDLLGS